MTISLDEIARRADRFWVPEQLPELLPHGDAAHRRGTLLELGASREKRPIYGVRVGQGPERLSLLAGAHADEPVGPSTLLGLCRWLEESPEAPRLLEGATFFICPHVNPDGAHRNRAWTSRADFGLREYLEDVEREVPGDDVEFGYPSEEGATVRPENRAVADFLERGARPDGKGRGPRGFQFHASLHGMAIAEGAWFLIDRASVPRTAGLRADLAQVCRRLGVPLHDWDRRGEKGFERIAPGFSTTPTSTAMRRHFEELGDRTTAGLFRPSSMEFVASLGGAPLAMVSEVPLFLVTPSPPDAPRLGHHFLEARDALVEARLALAAEGVERSAASVALARLEERFGLERLPHETAVRLQLAMIFLGSGLATLDDLDLAP
ncbi:MAG: M14 family zinc carboxypeptidase [Planctomycetota bacterium]|nr:M14 family zinc carboxypeptidase [Planctomycetota bacterium]